MGKGCLRFKSLEDLALDVVGRTVARVSAEEQMANYQAARALIGKGKNSAKKKGATKSAVKKGETKETTLATAGFVSQDMLTDSFFFSFSFPPDPFFFSPEKLLH